MNIGKRALVLKRTNRGERTLGSLTLAVGALALGLIAQDLLAPSAAPSPTDGLLALVGAGLLFVLAVLRAPRRRLRRRRAVASVGRSVTVDTRRWLRASTLLLLAAAMAFLSLAWFREEVQHTWRWVLYLGSLALFVGAAYLLDPSVGQGARPTFRRSQPRKARAGMVGPGSASWSWPPFSGSIVSPNCPMVCGTTRRTTAFGRGGSWPIPRFRPIYVVSTNLPAHFLYLVALAFRLFGDSMHAIRAVAVVFGLLTVVAAYFCGREVGLLTPADPVWAWSGGSAGRLALGRELEPDRHARRHGALF